MTTIASQITSLAVVHSTVYSDAYQSKHQSSASLAFVWGIHRDRWIPRTKGQLRGKCFHFMTSSCFILVQSMKCHVQLTQLKSINASIFPIYALLSTLNYHYYHYYHYYHHYHIIIGVHMSIYIFTYRFHILIYPGQSWRLKYHIRLYRSLGCGANIKQQNNPRALIDTDAGLILGSRLANERVARIPINTQHIRTFWIFPQNNKTKHVQMLKVWSLSILWYLLHIAKL